MRNCCAVGCTNRKCGDKKHLHFYKIPSGSTDLEQKKRVAWIKALKRQDWQDKTWTYDRISKQYVCSEHFVSGEKSENPNDIDFIPTKFQHTKASKKNALIKRRKSEDRYSLINSKRTKIEEEVCVSESDSTIVLRHKEVESLDDISSNASLQQKPDESNETVAALQQALNENKLLKEQLFNASMYIGFRYVQIQNNNKALNFYTGLPNSDIFEWVLDLIKDDVKTIHSTLTLEDHLLILFIKLKLGTMNRDLTYRFNVSETTISNIYRTWLPTLASYLKHLIIWPDRVNIRQNLPECFSRKFRDCVCIIDCSEIFIERPSALTARAQTWSNYKHNNTVKYLVGITPAGAVSFLSEGWGGRVSDNQITISSGFLDKVSPGDCVLADRGFMIQDILEKRGAILKIPSFTKGKNQLSARNVDESRQLAHVRIHVERVIGRLKDFHIIQNIIPISQVDLIDDVMVIICAAINLNKSVVSRKQLRK